MAVMTRNGFGNVYQIDDSNVDPLVINFISMKEPRLLERIIYSFMPAGQTFTDPLHVQILLVILRAITNPPQGNFSSLFLTDAGFQLLTKGNDIIHMEIQKGYIQELTMNMEFTFQRDLFLTIPPGEQWQILLSPLAVVNQTTDTATTAGGNLRTLTATGQYKDVESFDSTMKGRWR